MGGLWSAGLVVLLAELSSLTSARETLQTPFETAVDDQFQTRDTSVRHRQFRSLGQQINCGDSPINLKLWRAALNGDVGGVTSALQSGACIDVQLGEFLTTPVEEASQNGHVAVVRLLLDAGAEVNTVSVGGSNPLMKAAAFGQTEVAELLIGAGANIEAMREVNRETPVFVASSRNNLGVVELLISAGADVNKPARTGSTPLFIASQFGHEDVVEALLNAGAAVNQPRDNGATPLIVAVETGTVEVALLLLESGADPTITNNFGTTPLHLTAIRLTEGEEFATALLESGYPVDIDAIDDDGRTPLIWAARFGNIRVAVTLLNFGADQTIVENDGLTAEDIICRCPTFAPRVEPGSAREFTCPAGGCDRANTRERLQTVLRQGGGDGLKK